ncbi:MAG: TonB-dependent receptor [Xanthobacteraceae bacterium]|nr:TonB-dependent receptor [Xanthobacteraceae bacterium]
MAFVRSVWMRSLIGAAALCLAPGELHAQAIFLPSIEVLAGSGDRDRPPNAASELTIPPERILAQPVTRPGEALEQVPGLIVTQHSGEGKANQYFLRGFNLDHGTDIALFVDGMPINMRTHGHGQGYADINFLIPELIQSMRVRKGPYFAEEGDFASAGAVHIDYVDRLPKNLVQVTLGSFGYKRGLAVGSGQIGDGTVLAALEATGYDGPWDNPDRLQKFNGVFRYSQGTALDGFSVTAMAFDNKWNSTDQVAQRAIDQGIITRFGTLDPTDGGISKRYSLSSRWSTSTDTTVTQINGYVIRQDMRLFNNFTYFLDDPVNGDQFSQTDWRVLGGINASHTIKGNYASLPVETTFGVQTRYDDISLGLYKTAQRMTLSTVRADEVQEASTGFYVQQTVRWTAWIRTISGLRYDLYRGKVASDNPLNSGDANAGIFSPKGSVVLGPFNKTEFFLNAGEGFHSNDLRGVTITVDPNTGLPADRVPLLVKSHGGEIGLRTSIVSRLETSFAFFMLDYESELLFVGDAGTTEASRPSRRTGFEWNSRYQFNPWLAFDLNLAHTRARFTDYDAAGNFVPGAATTVISTGLTFGEPLGWFGAVKLRYFGPRPLIEDDSVRSSSTTLVNARLGYRFENGMRLWLDAINLFNAKSDQIAYYYPSRLALEPLAGVDDRHLHPVEPLAIRVTLAKEF